MTSRRSPSAFSARAKLRQYSPDKLVREHSPVPYRDATRYRECLRDDFQARCIYCLAHEREVAPGAQWGGFEVEHFQPEAAHGKTTYANLVWSCAKCNRTKGGWWPSRKERKLGDTFPKLSQEGFGRHIQIDDLIVVAVGSGLKGPSLIKRLGLNGAVHRRRRENRKLEVQLYEKLLALVKEQKAKGTRPPAESVALEKDLFDKFSPVFDDPPLPADLSAECACASKSGTGTA